MLVTKPYIKLHKDFFSVTQKNQNFVKNAAVIAVRMLRFAENILAKYNGAAFYDFDFSAFVFLENLTDKEALDRSVKQTSDEIRQALNIWNVFQQNDVQMLRWNSTGDVYYRIFTLHNHYSRFSPRFLSQYTLVDRKKVSRIYSTTPFVTTRKFQNIVWQLREGNQIAPARQRIKRDFARQMKLYHWVQAEYKRSSEEISSVSSVFPYSMLLQQLSLPEKSESSASPLTKEHIHTILRNLSSLIDEKHMLSVLFQQWSQNSFENFHEEKTAFLHAVQTYPETVSYSENTFLRSLTYRVESLTEKQWETFKEEIRHSDSQQKYLSELKSYMETIVHKNPEDISEQDIRATVNAESYTEYLTLAQTYSNIQEVTELLFSPQSQQEFKKTRQQIYYTVQRLEHIINERQILCLSMEHLDTQINNSTGYEQEKIYFLDAVRRYESVSSSHIVNQIEHLVGKYTTQQQWDTFKQNIHRVSKQNSQLTELKQVLETISAKAWIELSDYDIRIITGAENYIETLELEQICRDAVYLTAAETDTQRVQHVINRIDHAIHEKDRLSTLFEHWYTQASEYHFVNLEEEKQHFIHTVQNDTDFDDLIYKAEQYTPEEWEGFKESMRRAEMQRVRFTELKNRLETQVHTPAEITEVFAQAYDQIENLIKPTERIQYAAEELDHILDEYGTLAAIYKRFHIEEYQFERYEQEKTYFIDRIRVSSIAVESQNRLIFRINSYTQKEWENFKEMMRQADRQRTYLVELRNEYVRQAITQLNDTIQEQEPMVTLYRQLNMEQHHFESYEQEKSYLIDRIRASSITVESQNELIFRINSYTQEEWENFKETMRQADIRNTHLTELKNQYVYQVTEQLNPTIHQIQTADRLENLVFRINSYTQEEWEYFKEIIHQTDREDTYLVGLRNEYIREAVNRLDRVIHEQQIMGKLYKQFNVEKPHFKRYQQEKAYFIDQIQTYRTTVESPTEIARLENLVFRVDHYTQEQWEDFKETLRQADTQENQLVQLREYMQFAVQPIQRLESARMQSREIPILDVRRVLRETNYETFSAWVQDYDEITQRHEYITNAVKKYEYFREQQKEADFQTYKNYFILCLEECRTQNPQLFGEERSSQQIQRVLSDSEGKRIHQLLRIQEIPEEIVEFERIQQSMIREIQRYDRTQWESLITKLSEQHIVSHTAFETVRRNIGVLHSAVNMQTAVTDMQKLFQDPRILENWINTEQTVKDQENTDYQIMIAVRRILRTYITGTEELETEHLTAELLSVLIERFKSIPQEQKEVFFQIPDLALTHNTVQQKTFSKILSYQVTDFLENLKETVQHRVITEQAVQELEESMIRQQETQQFYSSAITPKLYVYSQQEQIVSHILAENVQQVFRKNIQGRELYDSNSPILRSAVPENQSALLSYKTGDQIVLRQDADTPIRSSSGELLYADADDVLQLAPSVKLGRERLRIQETELEKLRIQMKDHESQVRVLTKEQIELKRIIKEQQEELETAQKIEQTGRVLMNQLQTELRMERIRRGIR